MHALALLTYPYAGIKFVADYGILFHPLAKTFIFSLTVFEHAHMLFPSVMKQDGRGFSATVSLRGKIHSNQPDPGNEQV